VRLAAFIFSGVLLAGCSRDRDQSPYAAGAASFVAEDAGQIPLTSPGTPTRMERSTIEVPLFEELPEADYGPAEFENDTTVADRAQATVSRQQRATDTVRIDSVQPAPVPLVRPQTPQPVPAPAEPTPPVATPAPRPPTPVPAEPTPPVPVPQPRPPTPSVPATPPASDTSGGSDEGGGSAPGGS
jgi:hypothetical protein